MEQQPFLESVSSFSLSPSLSSSSSAKLESTSQSTAALSRAYVSRPTEELVKVTVRENHDDGVGFTVGKLYFPWPLDRENNIPLYIYSKLSETTFDKIITYSYRLMDKYNKKKKNF